MNTGVKSFKGTEWKMRLNKTNTAAIKKAVGTKQSKPQE